MSTSTSVSTITVHIPTPLRKFTSGAATVSASGSTVAEVIADLVGKHEGLKANLLEDSGRLRSFVNLYVNDEDIRYLEGEQTAVSEGDTLSIVPSIAGGNAQ